MTALTFDKAFKYPFNRAKGMLNFLWVFLPIIGWFALGGYGIRIVQEFCKGKFKELPVFEFGKNLELGFFMFLKSLPFMIAYMVLMYIAMSIDPIVRIVVDIFMSIFVIPILTINFYKKETVAAYFEFEIISSVFHNLGDYILALLKAIALAILFILMIIVLVGLPAGAFTQNIFLADFYRRRVK